MTQETCQAFLQWPLDAEPLAFEPDCGHSVGQVEVGKTVEANPKLWPNLGASKDDQRADRRHQTASELPIRDAPQGRYVGRAQVLVDLAGEVAASLEPGVPPLLPTRAPACFPAGFPHRPQRLNLAGLLKATRNGRGYWHC
jgi:hypothetical protein